MDYSFQFIGYIDVSSVAIDIRVYSNNYSSMTESFFCTSPGECATLLRKRLGEPAPGRIQLLTGPRQIGKTTLLLNLANEYGDRAIYAACDGPEAAISGFWERLWAATEARAEQHGGACLFLDEIHLLTEWPSLLKGAWDRLRRRKTPVHVVATGSCALSLGWGSRESLAGRFERITLSHWGAKALSSVFGMQSASAADTLVSHGAYPGGIPLLSEQARWAAYIRDAIVEPAIGRDILAIGPVRKPALLRQVFAVAATSPAQVVALKKLQGQLQDRGALETISHYLALLAEAYLVAPLTKFSATEQRARAAPPKLVTLSNALVATMDPRGIPTHKSDPKRFGQWVENACLAFAWNQGQRVSYWREEPIEVDGVIDGSWGKWAIEVKTGHVETADLKGLAEFSKRYPSYKPLLVGEDNARSVAERAGIAFMPWRQFLLDGLSGVTRS